MKPLLLAFLVSGSTLTVALPSLAQPDTGSESSAVRVDYRKALSEMDKGNWQNARLLLLDLFKRSPTFDVAASLAEAEAKLGESAKAAQHFAYALKNVPPKEKAETSARIRAGLNGVAGNVATIRVSLNRPEADFYVDGEHVGSYPALKEVYLSPGKHTLEARAGTESEKRDVQAVAGASTSMAFMLVPDPSPASGLTTPAANDAGPASPVAPVGPTSPPAGDSNGSVRPIALIAGGSLAVVGFALGIGFGVASNKAEDDANEYRKKLSGSTCFAEPNSGDCKALADAVERQSDKRSVANVGWAIGAVGLVTVGVALLWPSPKQGRTATSARELSLGWQGDRLLLRGTF